MSVNDELGKRMKSFYEQVFTYRLARRMPVIIRLDGKAFHSFTKGFKKPFDDILIQTMQDTTKYLCENIQNCVLGYTQSDEISLLLIDYKKLNSEAWFDNEVQKMSSVSASMATLAFNKFLEKNIYVYIDSLMALQDYDIKEEQKYLEVLKNALDKGALFDARCFTIPKEEVTNYFYWRQLDAIRNSIQMLGQAYFSHNMLQYKTCEDIKNMLYAKNEIVWELLPICKQRGSCCIKQEYTYDDILIKQWIIDNKIPVFKDEGRDYIEVLVNY